MKNGDVILRADGSGPVSVAPKSARKGYSLAELYEHTASSIVEIVPTRIAGLILVCDEEGQINRKSLNVRASFLAGQPIVGDVLVCNDSHVK